MCPARNFSEGQERKPVPLDMPDKGGARPGNGAKCWARKHSNASHHSCTWQPGIAGAELLSEKITDRHSPYRAIHAGYCQRILLNTIGLICENAITVSADTGVNLWSHCTRPLQVWFTDSRHRRTLAPVLVFLRTLGLQNDSFFSHGANHIGQNIAQRQRQLACFKWTRIRRVLWVNSFFTRGVLWWEI